MDWSLPRLSWRFLPIWRRHLLVWKRLYKQSVVGNIAEPLITLFAFGYGLGAMLPDMGGVRYVVFLASGAICMNTWNAATFEALYSSFTRMHVQRSWEAMLNTPLSLDDVLLSELVWAATKSVITGVIIFAVIALLGFVAGPIGLVALPLLFLVGLAAAAIGLVMNALAQGYDFFTYYFTLIVTPMWFLSGIFFPLEGLPDAVRLAACWLPLSAAVALIRPLILGEWPADVLRNVLVLLVYTGLFFHLAAVLTRRRLLK
jgi:lipooligosaccharide transport system permease protein